MSELDALVRGVLESLDGAGALADWLQEHDREKEAVLLRRRMKAWQTDRWKAPGRAALGTAECLRVHGRDLSSDAARLQRLLERADQSFRDYIRERFCGVRPEQVPMWALDRNGVGHAVAVGTAPMPLTACGVRGNGFRLHAGLPNGGVGTVPLRVCGKCRKRLQTSTLKPQEAAA